MASKEPDSSSSDEFYDAEESLPVEQFASISLEGNQNLELPPANIQHDVLTKDFPQRRTAIDVDNHLINMPQRVDDTISREYDSPNLVSNVQEDEQVSTTCINNTLEDPCLAKDNNIQATYDNLADDQLHFNIKEVLSQCIQDLEQIRVANGIQHLLVIFAPGPSVSVYGEDIERFRHEIENVFADFGFEVGIQNRPSSGKTLYIELLARVRKTLADVIQKEVESELIVTAKEKQSDGTQLEVVYAIVPAHLLLSITDESSKPQASMDLVEPASRPFIYSIYEDESQAGKLQPTPFFKYRITTEIQSGEQNHLHMNDIAALKIEEPPKKALNIAMKPLPVPKQSFINFLAQRQSVVMVGGHVGRIVPSPIVIGNDCWAFGLHLAFVIPSTETSQMQRFEEGDCGKILHIQEKKGHWIPIAMLIGKYTVEIPEYGSSIYIAIILSEALNEIERDFGNNISDIQLFPTSSLYSDDETEQSLEESLHISSEEEFKRNKKRFTSLINLKELEVKGTNLASGDVRALERLMSLKKLTLSRCIISKIRFGLLTNLKELDVSYKLDADALADIGKLMSLEKLTMSFGTLKKFQFGLASLPNLKELNLSYSNIHSISPFAIENLDSLEKLYMHNCNFTKSSLRIASLPKLKELDFYSNKTDLDSSVVLENLVSLEKLNMHSCNLTKLSLRR